MPMSSSPRMRRRARLRRTAARLALLAIAGAAALSAPRYAEAQAPASTVALIQHGSELFEDQHYEESIQTLSAALVHPGSSMKERVEIYRLLAYNFIILKRLDEADAAVRGLLVLDESYSLPPTESPRFREFFESTRRKWEQEGKPGKSYQGVAAPPKPVRIVHTSPAEVAPGTNVKLTGAIEDEGGRVRGVQLAYRTGAKGKFITVPVTYTMGRFRTQLPAIAVKPPLVEYYLQAVDQGGLPVGSRGDATAPLRVAVPAPQTSSVLASPWFWIPVSVAVIGGAIATAFIIANAETTSTVSVRITE
jgi:hypothetical protein